MNKTQKKLQTELVGGVGVNVIEGDLSFALRAFRQELKISGKIREVFDRQFFEKKSLKRRKIIEKAKYKQKFF
jgi:ribosomal protein S21